MCLFSGKDNMNMHAADNHMDTIQSSLPHAIQGAIYSIASCSYCRSRGFLLLYLQATGLL